MKPCLIAGVITRLFAAAMLLLLSACEQVGVNQVEENQIEKSQGDALGTSVAPEFSAIDYLGRRVELNSAAQRIVALSPHIVENLYSAGLGDRIVATVDYADYPEAAKAIPRIGGYSHFSREAILQYRPDLVIGWAAGYQGFSSLMEQLEKLGIAVYADDPRQFADIERSISDFSMLAGKSPPQELLRSELSEPLARLREQFGLMLNTGVGAGLQQVAPVKVFYEIWHEPLQTLNRDHIVNQAIALCGGYNVFADAAVLAPKISMESVLAADPEVIVASAPNGLRPATLDNWRRWPSIDAVANEQLYHVHGDLLSRHTLRMVEGVSTLCGHIGSARAQRVVNKATDAQSKISGTAPNRAVLTGKQI